MRNQRNNVQPDTSHPLEYYPFRNPNILTKSQRLEILSDFVRNGNVKMVNPVEASKEISRLLGDYPPVQHQVAHKVIFEVELIDRMKPSEEVQALPEGTIEGEVLSPIRGIMEGLGDAVHEGE